MATCEGMRTHHDLQNTRPGLRTTAEYHLNQKGHTLDGWILDRLDEGHAARDLAQLLADEVGVFVSERQCTRWANHARQQEEATR